MSDIHALIVDDESPARDELTYLLAGYPDVDTDQARNANEALEMIRTGSFNLVFLDIHMPGRDGFYVLRESLCLPKPPLFVFITAFDQYAVRAFEENALDYLLKPVSSERLRTTVERVREKIAQQSNSAMPDLVGLLDSLGLDHPASTEAELIKDPCLGRITVEKNGRIQLLPASEVYYFEKVDRQVLVHTHAETLPCHGPASLDEMEARLSGLPFLRINRAMVVNLDHVREYAPWTGGKYCLVLGDDAATELTLSRGRVKIFKQKLGL